MRPSQLKRSKVHQRRARSQQSRKLDLTQRWGKHPTQSNQRQSTSKTLLPYPSKKVCCQLKYQGSKIIWRRNLTRLGMCKHRSRRPHLTQPRPSLNSRTTMCWGANLLKSCRCSSKRHRKCSLHLLTSRQRKGIRIFCVRCWHCWRSWTTVD
jgi:hypothetical protein